MGKLQRSAAAPIVNPSRLLADVVKLGAEKILNPLPTTGAQEISSATPVLILLAAGKGSRFGQQPKCIQPVLGKPLAQHSIDAFREAIREPHGGRGSREEGAGSKGMELEPSGQRSEVSALDSDALTAEAGMMVRSSDGQMVSADHQTIRPSDPPLRASDLPTFRPSDPPTVITVVGYRHEEVSAALGPDNLYVLSENPTGGTAHAVYEAFSVAGLAESNPLVVISMGDRVVPASMFRRLIEAHVGTPRAEVGGRLAHRRLGEGERSEVGGQTSEKSEATLTFLTARYEPPRHQGKGRVLRDKAGHVVRIIEQKDIAAMEDPLTQQALDNLTEGNCPLYAIRARTLFEQLREIDNGNAQAQFYLTDIIEHLSVGGREIRTVTTSPAEAEYDLLCADVTRPDDLAALESLLARQQQHIDEVAAAVTAIKTGRPAGQIASIARQLADILQAAHREKLGFNPDAPVAIGISGGRLRIAFMHPDMGRFHGPAWQMPIGAADASGSEQIVVLTQPADDGRIHLYPLDPKFRETQNFVSADGEAMYPGAEIADWHTYEGFGTRMSESLLLSLGYFSDDEVEARRRRNLPLPPASLRVSSSMRRPFALVGNAIASLRTLREGQVGAQVQAALGRERFHGLRVACTGGIPQGGFSSSSALTVATKNALNALYGLGISPDLLVHLACQAEYGTGVRAGSLDQATEQKGRAGVGTLISSNPADNYRILGTYPVPSDRFKVIFPYTVDRDRAAWQWSWGQYAESAREGGTLTAAEMRKMTGKAAEIAAILTRLPLDTSFFKHIERDLLADGLLEPENRRWIADVLRQLPLSISVADLRARLSQHREWYISELLRTASLDPAAAARKADATFESLFAGWREPVMRQSRSPEDRNFGGPEAQRLEIRGQPVPRRLGESGRSEVSLRIAEPTARNEPAIPEFRPSAPPAFRPQDLRNSGLQDFQLEPGVPLRAMLAYLFSEVAINFHLIHHTEDWIACVTRSQRGDRSVEIDSTRLPARDEMERELDWERGITGPDRLDLWLTHFGAMPYDYNAGLSDDDLSTFASSSSETRTTLPNAAPLSSALRPPTSDQVPSPRSLVPGPAACGGGNFFRGLALIDLAEAMLKRAFGADAVAVRVNAAGQGDYFQVHVDVTLAEVAAVKAFLEKAFYRRFALSPEPAFVETTSGGGAVGMRLNSYSKLPELVGTLAGRPSASSA